MFIAFPLINVKNHPHNYQFNSSIWPCLLVCMYVWLVGWLVEFWCSVDSGPLIESQKFSQNIIRFCLQKVKKNENKKMPPTSFS